jgi:hypothetical protein
MSVIGYTYQDDHLCPACTMTRMRANGLKVARGRPHEDAMRRAAQRAGIDFRDGDSYDSGDFPKAITSQQATTELTDLPDGERGEIPDLRCGNCGRWMVLGEKPPTEDRLARYVRDAYELPQALAGDVARELRSWGLSHPEFISEEDAREAAAHFPHAYLTYAFDDQHHVVAYGKPNYDGEECVHCGRPWPEHTLTCATCGIDVPVTVAHCHQPREPENGRG